MRLLLTIAIFSLVVFDTQVPAYAQKWREIVPLRSSRADVERILGPYKDGYLAVYRIKEGTLFIEYSSGPCRPDRKGGWNVAENTVVLVRFSPAIKKPLNHFKPDLTKFRRHNDEKVIGIIYYVNNEEGITYEVQRGNVDAVEYGPGKSNDHLYCGDRQN